jgi:hypothetical protein
MPAARATQRYAVLLVMPNEIVTAESANHLTQAPHDARHEPHTRNPRILRFGYGVWRDQHLRISGDHRLQPFPANEAVIPNCNSAPPAYDVRSCRPLGENLDVGPLHSKLRASRNFASCFLYSNAAVLGIEQPPGVCMKKKTGVSSRGDLYGSVSSSESPSGETCAASRHSKLLGKLVSIRPAVRASRILDEFRAAAAGRPSLRRKGGRIVGNGQPSERMPRTTKLTFAGLSPRRRMK